MIYIKNDAKVMSGRWKSKYKLSFNNISEDMVRENWKFVSTFWILIIDHLICPKFHGPCVHASKLSVDN